MNLSENDFFARINAINEKVGNTPVNGGNKGVALPSPRDTQDYGWDDPLLGGASYATPSNDSMHNAPVVSEKAAANSRLPKAIKESMLNETIDTSALERSGADELMMGGNLDRIRQLTTGKREKAQTTANNTQFDYSVLRDIINGCLDAKLNEYLGNLSVIGLKGGNIRLVDHKGNIYEAKLKKVGNTAEN